MQKIVFVLIIHETEATGNNKLGFIKVSNLEDHSREVGDPVYRSLRNIISVCNMMSTQLERCRIYLPYWFQIMLDFLRLNMLLSDSQNRIH